MKTQETMAKIPKTFIDELLTRIDIVDIINQRLPLKKTGSNHVACCPFHQEKTPSFTVSGNKQFYYCFGCGASGNAIGFLMQHDHLNFVEAIEQLAQEAGMTIPVATNNSSIDEHHQLYGIMQRANAFYQQQLRQHQGAEKVTTYLKNRGLSGQVAKKFGLGFAPPGWDNLRKYLTDVDTKKLLSCGLVINNDKGKIYDRFRDRVMFPIRDRQGRIIGFGGRILDDTLPKYLNSPETSIFHKGSELYGLHEALQTNRQLDSILVVEGYMDVIALAQFDITNTVATLGTAMTKLNVERLFRQASNVTFCFDGDSAGRTAAWRALENILPLLEDGLNVRFMFLPEDEDPDSLVRRIGKTDFEKLLNQAQPLSTFLLNRLSDTADLSSLDGRSRLIKFAEPLLKQIPGKVLQQLLVAELAKRAQIDDEQLFTLLKLEANSERQRTTPAEPIKRSLSLMQRAISLLLQHPECVKNIHDITRYQEISLPGANILHQLLELAANSPKINAGVLLEHWREHKLYSKLAMLAMRKLEGIEKLSGEQISEELQHTLKRLEFATKEQQLSILHIKYAAGELDQTEQQAYLELLSKQRASSKNNS